MASDSPSAPRQAAAERIGAVLDALEKRLDRLEPGVSAELVIEALTEPVRALGAAVREGVR